MITNFGYESHDNQDHRIRNKNNKGRFSVC